MGVDAFLPGSQIALPASPEHRGSDRGHLRLQDHQLNKRRRNIVVSRRIILERERKKKRSTLVKELLNGQVREGIVKNITDFGAFIDLGGPRRTPSHHRHVVGRVGHPSEVVDIGQKLDVKCWTSIGTGSVSRSGSSSFCHTLDDIEDRNPVGAQSPSELRSLRGVAEGRRGVGPHLRNVVDAQCAAPSKLVSIADEIEAVVLKVDPNDEKISLGMKQIEEDPWLAFPVKYPTGTQLSGTVRNLTSFGAFVEIESGIDGLVHVSDMSWTRRVEHPSEVVQKGERVDVMVLDVDADNKRISLGIKQLFDDPWPSLVTEYARGQEVEGSVVRLQDRGVVVDLGHSVEGFVPGSHSAVGGGDLEDYFHVGDTMPLRVISSDASDRRIVLEVLEAPERRKRADPSDEEAPSPSDEETP